MVVDGWPLRRAAKRFDVSVTTAARWSRRYRELGEAGLEDRRSQPRGCPHPPGGAPSGACWDCA
ncbi:helix-turn-helix domain-containing protein [Arthrobacter sp. efr-133-TYG-120]|uniref:helix-turn-helix domain-containing protein n=1 Tax=Arthrobacter sp. efr-133-TYG-120 TaxID=3040280 RepID=UPI0033056F8D